MSLASLCRGRGDVVVNVVYQPAHGLCESVRWGGPVPLLCSSFHSLSSVRSVAVSLLVPTRDRRLCVQHKQ